MKRKLLQDLLSNCVRVILSQLFSFAVFFLLAFSFTKDEFGEFNWCLATLLIAFTILSFGIDQLVVKKIAEGKDASSMISIYFFHTLIAGLFFYFFLLILYFTVPLFNKSILLLLGFGKLILFLSSPFKQLANGLEKFRLLNFMSITSISVKCGGMLILFVAGTLSLENGIIVFVFADVCEFLISFLITKKVLKIPLKFNFKLSGYFQLIRESLPQAGVVVFTSTIARFDWVFLGIFATNLTVAEYSFAYKVFEASSLPLLIIAPLLIPRFSKILHSSTEGEKRLEDNLIKLIRIEMVVACFTALMLNILWLPVVNLITHNKYGSGGSIIIFILSFSIPLLYLNNLLWTVSLVNNKFKMIFKAFLLTFVLAIGFDILLIPIFKGNGAAIAYVIALTGQFIFFLKNTSFFFPVKKAVIAIIACTFASVASELFAAHLLQNTLISLLLAVALFIFLLVAAKQIIKQDFYSVKKIVHL
jgi:O-antigen/teichoic acid export membrane protein